MLQKFLTAFQSHLLVVGSRGRGDHREDSDVDLHIVDMMETDDTYDKITKWLEDNNINYGSDKWGAGSIVIPEQPGFQVSCELGFWTGIGDRELLPITVFDVQMLTPTV